jgi:putative ABC transport system ATP-binding protein
VCTGNTERGVHSGCRARSVTRGQAMDAMLGSGATPAGAGPSAELVRLTGVHKVYGRGMAGVHALYDINMQVAAGEIVAICGPSGHGKTTLLNLIGMLEPATEGSVVITSLLTSRLSEQARADLRNELIGYVFQSFSLVPVMTAQENVLLPLTLRGRMKAGALEEAQALAGELLARVGLKTQTHHYPARLDASQCQRVAIARALVSGPRLVVADEAASRLDSGSVRLVMDLFASYQRQYGTTFVISTRDQRQLSRVSRTLQLNEGRLSNAPFDATRKTLRVQG